MNPTNDPKIMAVNRANLVARSNNALKEVNGNVVPNTPTVPVNNTPAPATTLKDRYAAQKESINTNPVYNAEVPNENAIREEYRNRNMGYIDAIKSQFDKYIAEDTQAKQDLSSRAYLGALAGGLSGTISGATKEYKAAVTGDKKIRETKAQRDLAIAQIEQNADLRASEEFNKKRAEYINTARDKQQAEVALSGNIRKTAEAEITDLARVKSYGELSPKLREQYKSELNLDDESLQALFVSKTPQAKEVKLADGSIVYYQPETDENGNLNLKEVGRIRGSGGKTIKDSKITDGGVQILYSDGTYEFKGNGGNTIQSKPITGAPASFKTEDIAKGREILSRSGKEGYADPGIYYGVYKKWVEEGGNPKKFLELYPPDELADPSMADMYPTFLQPSKTVMSQFNPTTTTPTTSTPATAGTARTY